MISQGRTNSELTGQVDKDLENNRIMEERGRDSESKTKERLKKCPYINRVSTISGNDVNDRRRKDLVVEIDPEKWGENMNDVWVSTKPIVYVQVKSSPYGVVCFYEEIQHRQRCDRKMAEYILRNQRIVVLDASANDDALLNSFETQTREINQFWKTKNTPLAEI